MRSAERAVSTQASDPTDASEPSHDIGRYIIGGLVVMFLLVGGVGGWAATTSISGAVLAQGTVVVDTNLKKIQHPSGGVVGEIHVKDGQKVIAGDLLIRLDETVTR